MYSSSTRRAVRTISKGVPDGRWYGRRPRSDVERDWLGRRIDLKEFHRDPTCRTHNDPLDECSCHALFRDWDWILDWALCIGIVATVVILTWTLATVLAPPV